jgi:hypothetical protein
MLLDSEQHTLLRLRLESEAGAYREDLSSPLVSTRNLTPELASVVKLVRLGKGSSSHVYLAVHVQTLQVLALKEVEIAGEGRHQFRTEVQTLKMQRRCVKNLSQSCSD